MQRNVTRRDGYSFTLVNIDCLPDSTHFNIIMDLDESIEDLFPYLAARLTGCTYTHGTGFINLMDAGHIVSIYPTRITLTDVVDPGEAESLCEEYFKHIQDVKATRCSIVPVFQKRSTVTVLDIFRSLPKTNCGLCEATTCLAFAAKVFRREESIGGCEPVRNSPEDYRGLIQQLSENGYPVP